MVIVVVCGLLVLAGVAALARWGGLEVAPPELPPGSPGAPPALGKGTVPPPGWVARRYVWALTIAVVSGAVAGLLIAGPGGRLAMRLLAATSGDGAQGAVTEADEIVGRITLSGTLAFVVFVGLLGGMASGVLYMLVRRWLPGGRLGGLTYGGLLLVVAASRIDPLRRGNPDFDLVGPGWLALAVFCALVLAHGMVVAAVAARYSRSLPLLARRGRAIAAYAPLVILTPAVVVLAAAAIAGLAIVGLSQVPRVAASLRSRTATVVGRAVVAGAALISFPGFVGSVVDIAGRGP